MKIYTDKTLGPYCNEWVPAPSYLLRRARILRLLKELNSGKLLEIGCGAGALLIELHALSFTCTAVEESKKALNIAKVFNQATDNKLYNCLNTISKINFDYVCAFEVLEHIENDFNALKSWRTLLAADGKLLLSVPAHRHKWNSSDEWAGHVKRYEKQQLIDLINHAGFEVLHFECYGFPLANLIEPIRAMQHKKELDKRNQKNRNIKSNNNHNSGIARNLEKKLFFLLNNPVGKLVMLLFINMQSLFAKFDIGNGYIVMAKPKKYDL